MKQEKEKEECLVAIVNKKNGIIFSLLLGVLAFMILYSNKNDSKEKVYLLVKEEQNLNWEKYRGIFPNKFNEDRVLINNEELLKLDNEQKYIYDSIIKHYYSEPKIVTRSNDHRKVYFIVTSRNSAVLLEKKGPTKNISLNNLKNINILPLDSIVKILPGLEYKQLEDSNEITVEGKDIDFNLIIIDSSANKAKTFSVNPVLEEYE